MNIIEKMNKIVEEFQCEKINGIMVDVQTANMVTTIYKGVKTETKEKILKSLENDLVDGVSKMWTLYNRISK